MRARLQIADAHVGWGSTGKRTTDCRLQIPGFTRVQGSMKEELAECRLHVSGFKDSHRECKVGIGSIRDYK